MLAELRGMLIFRVLERTGMVVVPGLESAGGDSNICAFLTVVFSLDVGLVNDSLRLAFPRERASFDLAAITWFGCGWILLGYLVEKEIVML